LTVGGAVALILAIPTRDHKGLDDVLSDVFARSKFFTLVKVNGKAEVIKVVENPYFGLKYGVGPLVLKMLRDEGVEAVIVPEIGEGLKQLAEEFGIKIFRSSAGVRVAKALELVTA